MTNGKTALDHWIELCQHGTEYDAEVLEICPEHLRAEYEHRLNQQIAKTRGAC